MLLKGPVVSCTPLSYQIHYGARISHPLGEFLYVWHMKRSAQQEEELQIEKQNQVPKVKIKRTDMDIKEFFYGAIHLSA